MKIVRLSKILLVLSISFFAFLVAFGNITDYYSNFEFVKHVLLMDTIFESSTIKYRSIDNPILHHIFYIFIILAESLTAIICFLGAYKMFKNINSDALSFNKAKFYAIIGLTLGFLTWYIGFNCVGGEWFGMWMSKTWNGISSAFRFFITILCVLIYVNQKDEEL